MITCPDNIRELVIAALVSESKYKKGRIGFNRPQALSALGYLATVNPALMCDDEIRELVIEYLGCRALGYRNYAAIALHAIDDPLGIVGLTHNCLSTHPVTEQYQPSSSGWGDAELIRRAQSMTDECVDLLIQDVQHPAGYFHADALSALPAQRIVPKMLPLLGQPLRISAQAAYVLAMKSRDEGRAILERLVESMNLRYVELATIGLSHIPDRRAAELVGAIADPVHPIYGSSDQVFALAGLSKKELLTKSAQRSLIMAPKAGNSFIDIMKRFYLLPPAREWNVGSGITIPAIMGTPELFETGNYCVTRAPDFIAEFATESDRAELARIQTNGVCEFLEAVPMDSGVSTGWPQFMLWQKRVMDSRNFTGENVLGVQVVNDKDDYIFAATDWLLNPQDYRAGSHRRVLHGLDQPSQPLENN